MPRVTANATELYYEVRGAGPPVLLMMGLTGDGGHFDELADLLADEFTVISYDRRGNGRSPAPAGWQTTSPEEQADDAAALLHAVGAGPVVVFGTSAFPTSQYDEIWRFMRRHRIAPSRVVTHRFAIEDGAEAFRIADTATTGKVCFAFG